MDEATREKLDPYNLCDWWFDQETDEVVWLRLVCASGHLMDIAVKTCGMTVNGREIEECLEGTRERPPDHSMPRFVVQRHG